MDADISVHNALKLREAILRNCRSATECA